MDPAAPFGGVKASGYGPELGPESLHAFRETTSISWGRRRPGASRRGASTTSAVIRRRRCRRHLGTITSSLPGRAVAFELLVAWMWHDTLSEVQKRRSEHMFHLFYDI